MARKYERLTSKVIYCLLTTTALLGIAALSQVIFGNIPIVNYLIGGTAGVIVADRIMGA